MGTLTVLSFQTAYISPRPRQVFTGHSRDVHSLHMYGTNRDLLNSESVPHRITAICCSGDARFGGNYFNK